MDGAITPSSKSDTGLTGVTTVGSEWQLIGCAGGDGWLEVCVCVDGECVTHQEARLSFNGQLVVFVLYANTMQKFKGEVGSREIFCHVLVHGFVWMVSYYCFPSTDMFVIFKRPNDAVDLNKTAVISYSWKITLQKKVSHHLRYPSYTVRELCQFNVVVG